MILHTTSVEYLGDYRLFLSFDNGELGEVDLDTRLHGEIFEPLRDKSLFATAHQHPMARTVAWNNGADLAPEYLLDLVRSQRRQAAGCRGTPLWVPMAAGGHPQGAPLQSEQ